MNGVKPMGKVMRSQAWMALVLLLLPGCAFVVPSSWSADTRGFEVMEFVRYTQFPGVETNLYATEMHRLKIMATLPKGAEGFELWVDSVSLPARQIRPPFALAQNFDGKTRRVLQFSVSRHRYRQGSPDAMQLPEEKYKVTGEVLEGGEAWLVFVDQKGRQTRWPLGVPEQRPNRHAP